LIGEWNLLSVSLGIRILILNYIRRQILIDFHWFLKDEEAMDWRERFHNFHWTKKTSSRRSHEKLGGKEFLGGFFLGLFFLEKGGER
jgi:hypothetical protein